jgi:hypothetical protein
MILEKNTKINEGLEFTGWHNPTNQDITGYQVGDYFEDGRYLGPDKFGVEPEFDIERLTVSGHGGRDGSMCDDGEIVVCDGEPYMVICDDSDGWHVTGDPMARNVLAQPLDWYDVDEDEIADDVRCI